MSKAPYSWSEENIANAAAEGWYIWADTATGSRKQVLCPVESSPAFKDDKSVIAHVYARAMEGSELHQKALQLSLQTSPAFVPPRIGINYTGGVIQSVFSDGPAELMVIDYETDMVDEDRIVTLPQDDGSASEAYAQIFGVDIMPGEYDKYAPTIHAAELERSERESMFP